ncbi:MAG: methyltransferase domain-containing protein [Caldilineaceae bacterium]|nr:methyltransferase domain-containing protein [Caldilineaceae bacterium]
MALKNQVIANRPATKTSSGPGIGYRLLYFFGITPWDHGRAAPQLVELIEGPDAPPPGRALDLGCGTGTQAIYLAQKGWQVTGVDYVHRALDTARQRAAAAHVTPTWVEGDVTRLSELGINANSGGYNLLLDFGCFHGLTPAQCAAYAAGISAVAAPGATFLLFSFAPGKRGPAPRGLSPDEIDHYFGAKWELLSARPASEQRLPFFLKRADPTLYRMRLR